MLHEVIFLLQHKKSLSNICLNVSRIFLAVVSIVNFEIYTLFF
jgi:hypothetical protein